MVPFCKLIYQMTHVIRAVPNSRFYNLTEYEQNTNSLCKFKRAEYWLCFLSSLTHGEKFPTPAKKRHYKTCK